MTNTDKKIQEFEERIQISKQLIQRLNDIDLMNQQTAHKLSQYLI